MRAPAIRAAKGGQLFRPIAMSARPAKPHERFCSQAMGGIPNTLVREGPWSTNADVEIAADLPITLPSNASGTPLEASDRLSSLWPRNPRPQQWRVEMATDTNQAND